MFDNFFAKVLIFVFSVIMLFHVFFVYSPASEDRLYIDFISQVRFLRDFLIQNELRFDRNSFIRDVSYLFNVVEIKDGMVVLSSSYRTNINVYYIDFVYVEILSVSNDSYIPLKSIIDVDSFLDDGVPSAGLISSKDGKYYLGCTIVLKNR